ncbi:MAG: universal stress protein [Ignavibacteriaceae bacterium]
MFDIKNILLTTDFSKISLAAAEHATALAEKYNAKIHLLYVLEKTPPILTIRSLDLSEEKIRKSIEEDADNRLKETVRKIKKNNIDIIPVIRKGIDYEEINKYCKKNQIDLIVLASHGRTGILHTLIGSVAEKVIRHSKTPVLVVSPPEG